MDVSTYSQCNWKTWVFCKICSQQPWTIFTFCDEWMKYMTWLYKFYQWLKIIKYFITIVLFRDAIHDATHNLLGNMSVFCSRTPKKKTAFPKMHSCLTSQFVNLWCHSSFKKKMHIDGKNGHDGKNSQRYKVESPKIVIKTLKSICQETRHLNSNVIRWKKTARKLRNIYNT